MFAINHILEMCLKENTTYYLNIVHKRKTRNLSVLSYTMIFVFLNLI